MRGYRILKHERKFMGQERAPGDFIADEEIARQGVSPAVCAAWVSQGIAERVGDESPEQEQERHDLADRVSGVENALAGLQNRVDDVLEKVNGLHLLVSKTASAAKPATKSTATASKTAAKSAQTKEG